MPSNKTLHKSTRFIFLATALLLQNITWAHNDMQTPVEALDPIPGVTDKNRAGYGSLNASSEAEANALFGRECPAKNADGTLTLCVPINSPLQSAFHQADKNLNTAFTQLAQENAAEYLLLQQTALGEAPGILPSCFKENRKLKNARKVLGEMKELGVSDLALHLKDLSDQIKLMEKIKVADRTAAQKTDLEKYRQRLQLGIKLRAVRASVDPNRMAQALILDHQLKAREKSYLCDSGTERLCMSIKSNRDRIRLAFPILFPGGVAEQIQISNPAMKAKWEERDALAESTRSKDQCGRTPYKNFERSIARLMGFNGAPDPMPNPPEDPEECADFEGQEEAAIARGENILSQGYAVNSGYPMLVTTLDKNGDGNPDGFWNQAYKQGKKQKNLATSTLFESQMDDPRMLRAFNDFESSVGDLKKMQKANLGMHVANLCAKDSLSGLMMTYPQAVRQTVLDQNEPASREGLMGVLCQNDLMGRLQLFNQSLDCSGVSGDLSSADGVHVERANHFFPFENNSNYKLKKLADGTLEVSSKINYVFSYDSSLDPNSADYPGDAHVPKAARQSRKQQEQVFKDKVAAWTLKSSQFLNQMGGDIAVPKVKFKIEACPACSKYANPRVEVSACYNRERPASFAKDYPGQTWNAKRCWYKDGKKTIKDWQTSGNYSLSSTDATVMHETGHNLGLGDEYVADYYPSNSVGEYGNTTKCSSTMGSTKAADCHQLFPRHLLEITRPARVCPKNQGTP